MLPMKLANPINTTIPIKLLNNITLLNRIPDGRAIIFKISVSTPVAQTIIESRNALSILNISDFSHVSHVGKALDRALSHFSRLIDRRTFGRNKSFYQIFSDRLVLISYNQPSKEKQNHNHRKKVRCKGHVTLHDVKGMDRISILSMMNYRRGEKRCQELFLCQYEKNS